MTPIAGVEMGRITVAVAVANNRDIQLHESGMLADDRVRRAEAEGVIDTGATHLVLPQRLADELGLPRSGEATVRYADNRQATRSVVEQVSLALAGRSGTFRAIVEPDRTTVLVGAIVLEDLDLMVDCARQTVAPRDPEHYTAELE